MMTRFIFVFIFMSKQGLSIEVPRLHAYIEMRHVGHCLGCYWLSWAAHDYNKAACPVSKRCHRLNFVTPCVTHDCFSNAVLCESQAPARSTRNNPSIQWYVLARCSQGHSFRSHSTSGSTEVVKKSDERNHYDVTVDRHSTCSVVTHGTRVS